MLESYFLFTMKAAQCYKEFCIVQIWVFFSERIRTGAGRHSPQNEIKIEIPKSHGRAFDLQITHYIWKVASENTNLFSFPQIVFRFQWLNSLQKFTSPLHLLISKYTLSAHVCCIVVSHAFECNGINRLWIVNSFVDNGLWFLKGRVHDTQPKTYSAMQ